MRAGGHERPDRLWFENHRFSGLQWLLADVATDLHAARLLFSAAASKLDRGERASVDTAHAKKFATRAAMNGIIRVCNRLARERF
ncbi:hypothetical protein IVA81_19190 [Bradyrhizobium sp. 141]|nr:hypothetical protein [Bradyrhizobium sp. 141]